ncbi:uncharacterized protein LOC132038464 [Lycium ferocissimum]|uniref:uncharacterized protein LOC132038464 n=1 Tax=Lycium ferocissimum TaxID=112874 RepID=UPI0028160F3F|nr:uncharacterized protein LOC132038464 [Lycium ferocissimum]
MFVSGVKVGQTGKFSRGQVTLEMVIVFDPGGGTFYVIILEDRDGVLEAISKAITNLFICNEPLSINNFDLHHLTSKWPTEVELVILASLDIASLTTSWEVISKDKSYSILVSGHSGAYIKQVLEFVGFNKKEPEVTVGVVASVIHVGSLESAKATEIDLSVFKVDSSWFYLHTRATTLDKHPSLDKITMLMSVWLYSNHEDKVLFEEERDGLSEESVERHMVEQQLFGSKIRNIVAVGGPKRTGEVPVERWGDELKRVGFLPISLSGTPAAQGSLLLGMFPRGYTLVEENGCLKLGWKDLSLLTASTWQPCD